MSYVLGIDVSTTATKAVLVDEDGGVAATAVGEYELQMPQPLWSEQEPEVWWEAARTAIQGAMSIAGATSEDVIAVGLTGQMHGLVLLDSNHKVLRPAILWNDQRTSAECDEIRHRIGRERLIAITGNDAVAGLTAPKIQWVRNNEPDLYGRIAQMLLPKDYVRFRLTELYATDKAGAGGTLLMDLTRRDWSPEILDALEIDPALLPPTHEGPVATGVITAAAAVATGLAAGTPVVAGAGDQAANAVGTGAVGQGVFALSLGTSGVVFVSTEQPRYDPEGRLHAFPHAIPDRWHLMGVMLSAAGSFRWFRDTFAPGREYDELTGAAASIGPGAEGLTFLPYLTGERTPHPDPLARGAFVGLSLRHNLDHLTRAVLEGVAFGLKDILDLMTASGAQHPDQIRASGGGIRSSLWRQILADVLGAEIATVTTPEGAAFGAAMLAAVSAGWHADVDAVATAWVTIGDVTAPGSDVDRYHELHGRYQRLYPALQPWFMEVGLELDSVGRSGSDQDN
ncbi:MAG: xylulokinase [Acidimicrobiia bacterium]|nr:xylulokinase [Acidimicrobiia bacterium]